MSLRTYQWPRLVILKPNATVFEAARALDNNQVGAVLVQQERRITGIITDRDLTVRVTGQGLDPKTTTLDAVMTKNVATLPVDASRTDAVQLMVERRIRRIPLVEDGTAVGVVTLDDLIADESVPLAELAEVVRAQIGEGGPAMRRRELLAARRREARREQSYRRLINEFRSESGISTFDQADAAFMVVVSALVRRLTPGEAKDFIAQLPLKLAERLRALPPGPDKELTGERILKELADCLRATTERAREVLDAAMRTLDAHVTPGEMEDVRSQLPKELRELFTPASAA